MGAQPSVASQVIQVGEKLDFKGVNPITWGLAPGMVTVLLMFSILGLGYSKGWFSGAYVQRQCTGTGANEQCKDVTHERYWRAVGLLIATPFIGLMVGGSVYNFGLAVYNPKKASAARIMGWATSR